MKAVLFVMVLLSFALPAAADEACTFTPRSFEQNYEAAKVIFIGAVSKVMGNKIVFAVERGIKGVADGAEYQAELSGGACDVDFKSGGLWLYMGNQQVDGSIPVTDGYARLKKFGTNLVKLKYNYDVFKGTAVLKGTAGNGCAPESGSQVTINLNNGFLKAAVFNQTLEKIQENKDVSSFEITQGANISLCTNAKECGSLNGAVNIAEVSADTVSGRVETRDISGASVHYLFRANRLHDTPVCK